jgi:hypothetical protein
MTTRSHCDTLSATAHTPASPILQPTQSELVLHVVTGDCADAGTEAPVTVQLVGSDGMSLPVPLTPHIWLPPHDNSARLKPKFSRNQVRQTKHLRNNDSWFGGLGLPYSGEPTWLCHCVSVIRSSSRGHRRRMHGCGTPQLERRWVTRTRHGGLVWQSDAFRIAADRSIGAVQAVRVTVDTEAEGAGLYLARVELEDTVTGLWSIFPCGQWLDPSVGQTMRTLSVKTAGGGGGGEETMSSTLEEQLRGELSVERTRVKALRAESDALRRQLSAAATTAPEAIAAERDAAVERTAELQRQVAEIQAQLAGVEEEYGKRFDATITQLDSAHQVRSAGELLACVQPPVTLSVKPRLQGSTGV